MMGYKNALFSSPFFSAADFLKAVQLSKLALGLRYPKPPVLYHGGFIRTFFEIFLGEGSKFQLGMLFLRQKYILRKKYIPF
jgi:hypothetical protein